MQDMAKTIGILISILVVIIVGVLIYFSIVGTGELGEVIESFSCDNTTNITSTLTYEPNSAADFTAEYLNSSSGTYTTIPATNWTRAGKSVTFIILNSTGVSNYDANLSAARYTYHSEIGATIRDDVTPASTTIFSLAPLVAIVMIASVILGAVVLFGTNKGGI